MESLDTVSGQEQGSALIAGPPRAHDASLHFAGITAALGCPFALRQLAKAALNDAIYRVNAVL